MEEYYPTLIKKKSTIRGLDEYWCDDGKVIMEKCEDCGSEIFYVSVEDKNPTEDFPYSHVDVCFYCAKCGACAGGRIYPNELELWNDEEYTKWHEGRKKKFLESKRK